MCTCTVQPPRIHGLRCGCENTRRLERTGHAMSSLPVYGMDASARQGMKLRVRSCLCDWAFARVCTWCARERQRMRKRAGCWRCTRGHALDCNWVLNPLLSLSSSRVHGHPLEARRSAHKLWLRHASSSAKRQMQPSGLKEIVLTETTWSVNLNQDSRNLQGRCPRWHAYTHAHPQARSRARTHAGMQPHGNAGTHAHIHKRTRTYTNAHPQAHARAHARAHPRTRTHAHAHTLPRTQAPTPTHTDTHAHVDVRAHSASGCPSCEIKTVTFRYVHIIPPGP